MYRRRRDSLPTAGESAFADAAGAGGSLVLEIRDAPTATELFDVGASLAAGELRNPLRFLGDFTENSAEVSAAFAGGSIVSTIRPGNPQTESVTNNSALTAGALVRQVRDASAPTTETLTASAVFAGGSKV